MKKMERPQLKKKMKKRCAVPEKKLKELESILDQAIALPFPHINEEEEEEDAYETESRHRRVLLLCDEIDQRSFFLHSLLIAEISSCPSPPTEEGHLINIQRCLDALHRAYHEWTENFDPSLVQQYLGSDRPQPECTASCFNTDDEEEEEEDDEDIGELTESIVSTGQMSENPMELECCDDVAGAVVPAAEMVSVGVQTDSLLLLQDEEEEEESDDEEEKMKSSDCFREVTETEDEWEADAEEEEEEEAEKEEVMLVRASAAEAEEEEVMLVRASAAEAKGVVWMGCGMMMMMMGFMMIGRLYYVNFFNSSSNRCCFDYYYYYYYRFSRVSGGLLPT